MAEGLELGKDGEDMSEHRYIVDAVSVGRKILYLTCADCGDAGKIDASQEEIDRYLSGDKSGS